MRLRVKAFYSVLSDRKKDKATHVYIKGKDSGEEISIVKRMDYEGSARRIF